MMIAMIAAVAAISNQAAVFPDITIMSNKSHIANSFQVNLALNGPI